MSQIRALDQDKLKVFTGTLPISVVVSILPNLFIFELSLITSIVINHDKDRRNQELPELNVAWDVRTFFVTS